MNLSFLFLVSTYFQRKKKIIPLVNRQTWSALLPLQYLLLLPLKEFYMGKIKLKYLNINCAFYIGKKIVFYLL